MDTATDKDVFLLGDQLIDLQGNRINELANAAENISAKKKKKPCGMVHLCTTTYSWD